MNRFRHVGAGVVALLILGVGPVISAANARTSDEAFNSRVEGSLHKLGRGLANLGTCVFEIPRMTTAIADESGWIAGSTIGLTRGLWLGGLRALTGAFEVVTFPLEIPENYGTLMEPEFVFTDGDYTQ